MRTLRDENRELRAELSQRYEFDNIIGRSAAMREIFATIERVAPTRATVLLCGESGVGKDMIARAIHHHSPRENKPFVKINCSALPGKSDGERAVRLRKGRVHRRQYQQARQVRAGRHRHGFHGRDRRRASRPSR